MDGDANKADFNPTKKKGMDDYNHAMAGSQTAEIEDLRCERLPETVDKQVMHKRLLKVIILGDTGEFPFFSYLTSALCRYWKVMCTYAFNQGHV